MKIIIVDNYDSFTYNIAHYVEQFAKNCEVVKVDKLHINDIENFDKIILSPGPGLPNERPFQDKIIKRFYKTKAILGICLGHQALAEYFGAELINMNEVHHGVSRDTINIKSDYILNKIPKEFKTGRYHSWAVNSLNLPDSLEILSVDEITNTIMAFRHKKYDVRAVQFHPESVLTESGLQLIKNWVLN